MSQTPSREEICWIETYSGQKFHLLDPRQEEINLKDIAHALSQQVRYTGHVKDFYSVAEHAIHVSHLVEQQFSFFGFPNDGKMATRQGLMHDASEAYITDLSRPLKHLTDIGKPYLEIEERIMQALSLKFNFCWPMLPIVHWADNILLLAEKKELMTDLKWDDNTTTACDCKENKNERDEQAIARARDWIRGWNPREAEAIFLANTRILELVAPPQEVS